MSASGVQVGKLAGELAGMGGAFSKLWRMACPTVVAKSAAAANMF